MGGVNMAKRKHPEGITLTAALKADEDRAKAVAKKGIDKRATLVKAPDAEVPDGIGATMAPTPEQLSEINKFTRKTVSAEEVVCFDTMSMNDMVDRDDDQFSTDTVKEFSTLPQPFSPVGKSFMVDHDYKVANGIGRIFGVGTQDVEGAKFLTNSVYMPNTPQFQPLIEKIDFGINWAVSVGVTLEKANCTVCGAGFSSYGWWCATGHDKGLFYEKDGETDSWGFPMPVDSKKAGAIKCVRKFSGARDFYELSQVFLGAQYDAQIGAGKMLAMAKSAKVPFLGLSADEAKALPMSRSHTKLLEARRAGTKITEDADGILTWKDAENFQWIFDPADPEAGVLGLGKSEGDEEDDETEEEVTSDGEGTDEAEHAAEGDADLGDEASEPDADEDGDQAADGGAEHEGGDEGTAVAEAAAEDDDESDDEDEDDESDADEDDDESEDDTNSEEETDVDRQAVLASARKAKFPKSVIAAAEAASGNGLDDLLLAASKALRTSQKRVQELEPKAAMGQEFLNDLRQKALDAFIKANQDGDKGVQTAAFEKLLEKVSDDADILKSLIDQHTEVADKKFGKAVRRSSFPTDPHTGPSKAAEAEATVVDMNSKKVSRLHGG